ncbi:MAG: multicopper oxidase domain-containing protein [Acidimicrobiales bacterium]|nr:multicopper oxidase domain-containing protein [Acidimicrobiales bacterium]
MSPVSQSLLSRFAVVTSIFALLMVGVVAATRPDGGGSSAVAAGPVPVTLTEFAISPNRVVVTQGGSLSITNSGSQAHNVAITDTPLVTSDLSGGQTETLDVSSLEPGEYEIFCAVAGHLEAGMVGTLVVTDGSAAGDQAAGGSAGGGHAGHDDLASLDPMGEHAQRINKEFEDAMSAGVQTYLEYADKYAAGEVDKGNRKLEPEILEDGTKKFELTAAITDWEVTPGNIVKAWTYNEQVPGPWIRIEPGEKVQIELTNNLPISTDIHWHGISVPFEQDGVAPITQDYIRPGETYTYEFTAPDHPELGMYHAHMHGQVAIVNGLFAVFQVGDVDLPRGRTISGVEIPADLQIDQELPIVVNDAGVIGMSINGKGFPLTEPVVAKQGEWVLMHFYNEGLQGHPMHLHRQPQIVVAKDGFPLEAPYRMDTIWVSPGERYSVLVQAQEPGIWAFHCHIVSHAESDDGLFGMVTTMIVE